MNKNQPKVLRVAVLVDLPRGKYSGGHVKCWERIAAAARAPINKDKIDLTIYFSGKGRAEDLSPHTHYRYVRPIFSTKLLKFLPYIPDHTDIAPHHPWLARVLRSYDVIHTTDGFFNFSSTAARVGRRYNIPVTNSFHTDTPSYTRIFTQQAIMRIFGNGFIARRLIEKYRIPEKQQIKMEKKLAKHLCACQYALMTREEDFIFAKQILAGARVGEMRLGIDPEVFHQRKESKSSIQKKYKIPKGRKTVLFVGRLDVGKNIYTLTSAIENLIAQGQDIHLIAAGIGPAAAEIKKQLKGHITLPGFLGEHDLAELYGNVDMLALCSEVEIRSMVGAEALACHCPVLVSKASRVAQAYDNTYAMKVVDSGVKAWTSALDDVLNDETKLKSMRKAAGIYAKDKIASWQDVLTQDLLPIWEKAAYNKTGKYKGS